jgi:hypothetical protein
VLPAQRLQLVAAARRRRLGAEQPAAQQLKGVGHRQQVAQQRACQGRALEAQRRGVPERGQLRAQLGQGRRAVGVIAQRHASGGVHARARGRACVC